MDSFKIGTYQLGYRWVDLFADPKETGGSFYLMPDDTPSHARIRIGFDYREIDHPWCNLFHEVMEFVIAGIGCRCKPTGHYIEGCSDIYTFHFNHNEFTEIAAQVGMFIKNCKADFEAAWDLVQEADKK